MRVQASLARQHQVLSTTSAAIETPDVEKSHDIAKTTIARVGTELVADTANILANERRHDDPLVTVQEVAAVTQNAIALAVDTFLSIQRCGNTDDRQRIRAK